MHVLFSITKKLHKAIKEKFIVEARPLSAKSFDVTKEKPVWEAVDKDGNSLFNIIIARGDTSIKPNYLTSLAMHAATNDKLKTQKADGHEFVTFNNKYLIIFLDYLGFQDGYLDDRFFEFCLNSEVTEEEVINQNLLPKERERNETDSDIDKDVLKRISELRQELGKLMYATTKLRNTKWWFYFHGYTKYKILPEKENMWTLVKLLLVFEDIDENGELSVKIDNTSIEHYDYIGTIDFQSSRSEIVVMNLKTVPYLGRQLNIKLHVGTGEGDIFLGQYLNFEGDGHIISGNVVLERINERTIAIIQPVVYQIPDLLNGQTDYTENHERVSQYILQYLHDKNKNFRRTPLRTGHTLNGLKSWLRTRKAEGDNL